MVLILGTLNLTVLAMNIYELMMQSLFMCNDLVFFWKDCSLKLPPQIFHLISSLFSFGFEEEVKTLDFIDSVMVAWNYGSPTAWALQQEEEER